MDGVDDTVLKCLTPNGDTPLWSISREQGTDGSVSLTIEYFEDYGQFKR